MVKIEEIDPSLLVEAVLVWTGWGREMMPNREDSSLVKCFGVEVSAKILPIIKALEDDFYSSDARFATDNLQEMGKVASEQFRRKYPKIADEIIAAFAWCYTFDFR